MPMAKKNIILFLSTKKSYKFAAQNTTDSVAQLVEQLTLNQWVESSNLSGVTKALKLDSEIKSFGLFYFSMGTYFVSWDTPLDVPESSSFNSFSG